MPSLAQAAETLTALARSHSAGDRERLLAALGALCESTDAARRPALQAVLTDLLDALLAQAQGEERVRMAGQLADAPWTPPAIAARLAREPIAVSAAVIARSPALTDAELADIIDAGDEDHALAAARRPRLGALSAHALLARPEPIVWAVLAGNPTAELTRAAVGRLATLALAHPALRAPLARHPRLQARQAAQLAQVTAEPLAAGLLARFGLPPTPARRADLDAAALAAKLQAAGRLGPGTLLRFLREGRTGAFQAGLALLSGDDDEAIAAACESEADDGLRDVLQRGGFDRALIPEVTRLLQRSPGAAA